MAYMTQLEIHEACTTGDFDSLEEYISMGKYDLDCRDPDWGDRAPIHWACSKGYVDCVRLLLENEVNGSIRMEQKWTPAHCAAEAGKLGALRCLNTFNVSLRKKDAYGDTPRRIAQIYGHLECVKYLDQVEQERREKRRAEGVDDLDDDDDSDDEEVVRSRAETPKPREIRQEKRSTHASDQKKRKPKS